ncbi:hypothetical protein NL676_012339 [Syzygium grande]|nr:hypothetical protein NL676_012339 [Syzygium grande]
MPEFTISNNEHSPSLAYRHWPPELQIHFTENTRWKLEKSSLSDSSDQFISLSPTPVTTKHRGHSQFTVSKSRHQYSTSLCFSADKFEAFWVRSRLLLRHRSSITVCDRCFDVAVRSLVRTGHHVFDEMPASHQYEYSFESERVHLVCLNDSMYWLYRLQKPY